MAMLIIKRRCKGLPSQQQDSWSEGNDLTKIPAVFLMPMEIPILVIKEASIVTYYQSREVPSVAPTAAGISVRRDLTKIPAAVFENDDSR